MLKSLRSKIQTLNKTQRNILTIILILLDLFFIILWINFFINLKKIPSVPPSEEKGKTTEEVLKSLTAPNEGREISEEVLKSLTAPK